MGRCSRALAALARANHDVQLGRRHCSLDFRRCLVAPPLVPDTHDNGAAPVEQESRAIDCAWHARCSRPDRENTGGFLPLKGFSSARIRSFCVERLTYTAVGSRDDNNFACAVIVGGDFKCAGACPHDLHSG